MPITEIIETPSPFEPLDAWEDYRDALLAMDDDDPDVVALLATANRLIAEKRSEGR